MKKKNKILLSYPLASKLNRVNKLTEDENEHKIENKCGPVKNVLENPK